MLASVIAEPATDESLFSTILVRLLSVASTIRLSAFSFDLENLFFNSALDEFTNDIIDDAIGLTNEIAFKMDRNLRYPLNCISLYSWNFDNFLLADKPFKSFKKTRNLCIS